MLSFLDVGWYAVLVLLCLASIAMVSIDERR